MASRPSDDPYVRQPRRHVGNSSGHDEENIRGELARILQRSQSVASSPRAEFADGSVAYDVASMVMVRLASLTERSEFAPWSELLTAQELTSIRAMRNIAAYAGYAAMDDDLFWEAVTELVPEVVKRLLCR